jgi:hypothetical protein
MGLSIHYSGNFRYSASLPEMIEEIKDIAEFNQWNYFIYETKFPDNSLGKPEYNDKLYGISFSPEKCEPVCMCFLSNGILNSPINLQCFSVYAEKPHPEYLGMISTKTQYAGIEAHKTIINLIDYLSKKYLDNFKLSDEGQFWETRDEKLLQKIFDRYDKIMDIFALGLENIQRKKGESVEDFIIRVANQLGNKSENSDS